MEKMGSLPTRLRLLGLPGEARARRLLETCADLLKQDAIGATALLGGTESSIPGDAKWARELTDALSNGGEAEVRAAKDIENDLAELASLFPIGGQGVISAGDAAAIREALAAENIQEHLPALRGAVRSTFDRVKSRYAERRIKHTQLPCSRSSANLRLSRNGLDLKLTIEKSLPRNLHPMAFLKSQWRAAKCQIFVCFLHENPPSMPSEPK